MARRLTRPEVIKLAAEASRDPQTVERVLAGKGNEQSRAAVIAAAKRLEIKISDKPQ